MEEASYTDASRGTTVSRCVIACFRIFLVVEFVGIWENKLDEITAAAERETEEPASTSHPAINGILQALQGLIMLNVSALPTEWLHLKFLHLVSRVASSLCRKPEWNQFLIRLLEVSSIQETSISSHKKKYFELVDQIRARQVSRDRDDRTYFLAQECCSRIQSIEAALGSFQFVSGTPFVFSRTQDKSVPAWDETDHGRDYLIKADWKDHLTTVEFHSDLLKEVASVVVKAALKFDPGEQPETRPDNPILARPLYEHISQTNPPIRTYAAVEPAVKAPPTLNKDVAPRSIPSLRPGLMASTGGTVFDSQPPPVAIQRHTSTTSSTTLDDDDDAPPLRPEVVVGGKPPVKKELPDDPLLLKWSAPQSRSEPFSASAIAWWENGPKTADISPGKDTDDLSDSATSFTTTTSKSGSQYSAELLRSNSDRQREKQGHKGHCKCRKRLYAEPSGDNKRSSSSHKNEIPRVRMLEFTRVLRPPMSPHTKRSTSGESEPVMIRANYPQKENKTERESIPFLCLPTKPATHQSVYRIADFSQRGSEPANPSFQCASSKVGVRYLGEPKLPSSSVFCAPPPLLHLSKGHSSTPAVFSSPETRTHEHEYQLRNPANYTVGQQILREPCGAAPEPTRMGEVSSAQRDLDGSYPHAPIVSGTSHVSHPILSPDERIQFREYTDNLMAGGAGGESFNPSLQPTLPSQAPVPAPRLAQQEYESGKTGEEDGSGYANLLTQHNDFLNKAHDLMNQRERKTTHFITACQTLFGPSRRPPWHFGEEPG
ncbi:hypothetical protein AGDE_14824 [Angomonas deanei]|uniref:Uncharacterized protein n=1 Tax=Angomonas deanei TaxID=59799 RepID=A0A7G2CLJ4_9TRYP|nr:hypothetical protein AGDE_14824 [Angomonas deanei]CAD2220289.1 hypothetical protein, conserved [Angomonas deanei]|eukprot:EPY20152.1 hypothetical protein AGDE_14824 [Angomonas deanei]